MASKEEEFKQHFAALLTDLQQNAKDDPEAIWLMGSLAAEIIDKVGAANWVEFKQTMGQETYSRLLTDFEKEGNRQYREGDRKKAYAIQALAMSLVAYTQTDPQMRTGESILDQLIENTIRVFRQSKTTN